MTVVEHLAELRRRLIISIVAVAAAAALCYWFAPDIIRFFLEYYKDATNGQKDAFIFTGPLDAFVALITLPQALDFLIKAGGQEQTPLLTADRYLSLVTLMILAFGLAFEFPVVLVFLLIARVISTATLRRWRRWAIVLIVTFAAVITPSQDPYSLFFMAVPMYVFYEASIVIGRVLNR